MSETNYAVLLPYVYIDFLDLDTLVLSYHSYEKQITKNYICLYLPGDVIVYVIITDRSKC